MGLAIFPLELSLDSLKQFRSAPPRQRANTRRLSERAGSDDWQRGIDHVQILLRGILLVNRITAKSSKNVKLGRQ